MTSEARPVMTRADRRSMWVLGLALFVSYAYFYQAGGWSQNSRFAMIRAVLERHTLQIDAYHAHTGDLALWEGHYYTDKAPGASLLAVVPVAVARGIDRLVGVDPEGYPGIAWTSYVAAVSTSGGLTIVAALAVFWMTRRWGMSRGAALFAATAYGVASPAWCYATLFMGHAVAAGCLMLAFAAASSIDEQGVRVYRCAWAVGLACGWAVVTEFPAAVPILFIVVFALLTARDATPDRLSGIALRIVAGGAVGAVVLLAYNTLSFGSPFHLAYSSEVDPRYNHMREGLFGIALPRWWVLRELLVGSYRGLLPLAPLMAVTPLGLAMLARAPRRRRAMWVVVAITAFYFLMNASYFYWEGGWTYGPRHVTPTLPFLALGLAPLWDNGRAAGRIALAAGWLWGAGVTLVAVSTTPQPPAIVLMNPVRDLLWPAFRDGDLSLNHETMVSGSADYSNLRGGRIPHAAWNLGEIAGLHGHPSLVPLGVAWIAAAAGLWWLRESRPFE
jgi:hypothetical protein